MYNLFWHTTKLYICLEYKVMLDQGYYDLSTTGIVPTLGSSPFTHGTICESQFTGNELVSHLKSLLTVLSRRLGEILSYLQIVRNMSFNIRVTLVWQNNVSPSFGSCSVCGMRIFLATDIMKMVNRCVYVSCPTRQPGGLLIAPMAAKQASH